MLNQESVFRLLLNGPRNALPVLCAKHQGSQNQQIERALQKGNLRSAIRAKIRPTRLHHAATSRLIRDELE